MDESLGQGRAAAGAAPLDFAPRRALTQARRWAKARAAGLASALLLSVMALNMLAVVSRKSITIDEIVMIPAAYYHLAAGNFQLVHDHPPLSKILAGVPLLFIQPEEVQPHELPGPPDSPESEWAHQERFWEDNRDSFEAISFWARVPMIALAVALGALVFVFARDLFGGRAAALAAAFYSLEPTVLAHGRVVQTDVPAAFGYLLTTFAVYRYARSRTWRRALTVGAAGGLAVLAKFSMLLVGPAVLAVFAVWVWRARGDRAELKSLLAHVALVGLAALLVINAAYYFDGRALTERDARWVAESFPASAAAVWAAIRALSYLLPTEMVLGVFWQLWHNGEGHPASLLGMQSATGWWYYFPVAFALKVPLPFLLLSVASLAWAARALVRRRDKRFLFVLIPFAVYTAFVLMSRINIGVRYYLPAFPSLFILCGALLDRLLVRLGRHKVAAAALAALLLGWAGFEAARAFPDQMTYFNQLASARPHWWYLSDSNVEWGDDVRQLSLYLRARGETRVRGAFLAGYLTPRHYGVEVLDLLARPAEELPPTRYTAVGASFLNGSTVPARPSGGRWPTDEERTNTFDAYRRRTPEAVFGGSIYLFKEVDSSQ
ncbi:MAG TPA: phospholipid carrier-dependent glycosyltransferase [Pyrinomonadaceae bacterium]|nr:phospholipid carrier-dependent glycosyltransferase [Pyrinomonadaceae bacterium]